MLEELKDQPLYLVLDSLCNTLHSTTPSQAQFRSAILHADYKVSSTHANEVGFKTDAPVSGKSWKLEYLKQHAMPCNVLFFLSPKAHGIFRENKGITCELLIQCDHVFLFYL